MPISVQFRPSTVVWSKNYFQYQIRGTLLTVGRKLEVQFMRYDNNEVLATVAYPIMYRSQTFTITDCQELIDPHLSYVTPFLMNEKIEETFPNKMKFYVRFREYSPDYASPWYDDIANPLLCIKGGIGDMAFNRELNINHGSYSRSEFLPNGASFLTWIPPNRIMHKDEVGWIMLFTDRSEPQSVSYTVKYLDGSSYRFIRPMPANGNADFTNRTWMAPIGIKQAKLDPNGKGVESIILSKHFPGHSNYGYIWIDNRDYPGARTLLYRNSMGGLDSIYLRGISTLAISDPEKKEYRQHRILGDDTGETPYFDSFFSIKIKGNTGFISKEHRLALAELHNTSYCALMIDGRMVPMRVPPQKFESIGSEDHLHSYSIEFETAGTFRTLPHQLLKLLQ